MIMLAVAFLCYIVISARSGPNRILRNLLILLVAVIGVAAMYSVSHLGTTVYSSDNDRAQLLARELSGDTATLLQDSRVTLVSDYIGLISQHPILGHGTGFVMSQPQGPHNMFLTLWVENGVLGLFAYLMLLFACFFYFRRLADFRGQVFCLSVFVLSFFSHNILTTRSMIVTLGLLGTLAGLQNVARLKSVRPTTMGKSRGRSCAGQTEVGTYTLLLAKASSARSGWASPSASHRAQAVPAIEE
jgi:O-antigen ligase